MTALRELAERWKAPTIGTDWAADHARAIRRICADELISILDAMSEYSVAEVRARFEAWVSKRPWFKTTLGLGRSNDEYADPCINSRWQGWQAAYAERIEADESAVPVWRDGAPNKPWSGEWFIAIMESGDRVVLRELPDEYTYDFTTADDTYVKRDRIKRWMQFPDSQFIHPPSQAAQVDHTMGDLAHRDAEPVAQGEVDGDRAAYEGAREDLLDWKGRAQRAEATLRSLGYTGVDASEPRRGIRLGLALANELANHLGPELHEYRDALRRAIAEAEMQ